MRILKVLKNQVICQEGTQADEMYVVRKGKIRVYKMINSEMVVLGEIGANDCVGEMSLFLGSKRTASLDALEDTELLALDKESVFEQMKNDPNFGIMLIKKISRRLTDAHKIIAKLEGEKKSLEILTQMRPNS
jgi:CRP-like cAMP-binding protein